MTILKKGFLLFLILVLLIPIFSKADTIQNFRKDEKNRSDYLFKQFKKSGGFLFDPQKVTAPPIIKPTKLAIFLHTLMLLGDIQNNYKKWSKSAPIPSGSSAPLKSQPCSEVELLEHNSKIPSGGCRERDLSYNTVVNNSLTNSTCTTLIQPGTVIEAPLTHIHPSQSSVGHQNVNFQFESSKNIEPSIFAEKLKAKILPGVISPNGTIFISDGHHRLSVAYLKQEIDFKKSDERSEYKVRVMITDNYSNKTWEEFGKEMVEKNKIYFPKVQYEQFLTSLETPETPETSQTRSNNTEQLWENFITSTIPNNFILLPDNPLRSLLGNIFFELGITNGDFYKNYMEFHFSDFLKENFNKIYSEAEIKKCDSPYPEKWSCSELDGIKERLKDLITKDKSVQNYIASLSKEGNCKSADGSEMSCKKVVEAHPIFTTQH